MADDTKVCMGILYACNGKKKSFYIHIYRMLEIDLMDSDRQTKTKKSSILKVINKFSLLFRTETNGWEKGVSEVALVGPKYQNFDRGQELL